MGLRLKNHSRMQTKAAIGFISHQRDEVHEKGRNKQYWQSPWKRLFRETFTTVSFCYLGLEISILTLTTKMCEYFTVNGHSAL